MAAEWAVLAYPYMEYDGTNSEEIRSTYELRFSETEVTLDEADENSMSISFLGGAGVATIVIPTGSRLGLQTSEVVSSADWATKYAKP